MPHRDCIVQKVRGVVGVNADNVVEIAEELPTGNILHDEVQVLGVLGKSQHGHLRE